MSKTNEKKRETITILTGKMCARVGVDEIEMIEQDGRKLLILTDKDEYICYDKVESLAPILVNKSFYRAKKGLVINFAKVTRLQTQEVHFESGRVYGMGRNNFIQTKNAFRSYLLGYPPFVNNGMAVSAADSVNNLANIGA